MTAPRPLLEIEDLSVDLPTDEGLVRPVAQLSLRVNSGRSSVSWERVAAARA